MNQKIIFQKCNFNYIYFLFYVIMYFLDFFIGNYIYPNDLDDNEFYNYFLPSQILIDLYVPYIAGCVAIIPYFIRKI